MFVFLFLQKTLRLLRLKIEPAGQHDQHEQQQAENSRHQPEACRTVKPDEPVGNRGIRIIQVLHFYQSLIFHAASWGKGSVILSHFAK